MPFDANVYEQSLLACLMYIFPTAVNFSHQIKQIVNSVEVFSVF